MGRTKTGLGRWLRPLVASGLGVAAAAGTGIAVTDAGSHWYFKLRKPSWQPPAMSFPIVWTALYADIVTVSTAVLAELEDTGEHRARAGFAGALTANLALNAAWPVLFFRARRLDLAVVGASLLAISSIDLTRRAGAAGAGKALALTPYAAWTVFAAVLSATLAAENPQDAEELDPEPTVTEPAAES